MPSSQHTAPHRLATLSTAQATQCSQDRAGLSTAHPNAHIQSGRHSSLGLPRGSSPALPSTHRSWAHSPGNPTLCDSRLTRPPSLRPHRGGWEAGQGPPLAPPNPTIPASTCQKRPCLSHGQSPPSLLPVQSLFLQEVLPDLLFGGPLVFSPQLSAGSAQMTAAHQDPSFPISEVMVPAPLPKPSDR